MNFRDWRSHRIGAGEQAMNRDRRTIVADFISGFVGDDNPLEHWYPTADRLMGWLRDEGWEITRIDGRVSPDSDQTDGDDRG